ncbi:MAG: polar amino acid transport system substrate-binding protein [Enterobacterales bacterium]|jgi:polar amino acid transport system substrate-binding protein
MYKFLINTNFILSFAFLAVAPISVTFANETLIFSMNAKSINDEPYIIGKKIANEISKVMGLDINLIVLPGKRATLMLNNGKIHAELARAATYQKYVPDTIRVDEPIVSVPYYIYTNLPDNNFNNWEDLFPYKTAIIRGLIFVNDNLPVSNTLEVSSSTQAFNLLNKGRVDLFITNIYDANSALSQLNITEKNFRRIETVFKSNSLYTYFSPKYPKYAEKYKKALIEIKKQGIINKIMEQYK